MSPNFYPQVILCIFTDERRWLILFFGCALGVGNPTQEFQTCGAGDCSDQELCSPREGAIWFLNPEAKDGNGVLFLQVPGRAECVVWNQFPVGNMLEEIKRGMLHLLRE